MDSIINLYKDSGVPLELEYRYKLNKVEFLRLYTAKTQIRAPTYIKSLSYVMPTKAYSVVKEVYYDTDPPRTEFRIKKKLSSLAIGNNKLVLSEEQPAGNMSINSAATIIRQKLRASILDGDFSYDFTLVRRWDTVEMLNASKRAAIIGFMKSVNLADTFVSLIDRPDYNVELELEFKGTVPTREIIESLNYQLQTTTDKVLTKLCQLLHPTQKHLQPNFNRLINHPHEFNRQTFHVVLDNITAYSVCAKTNGQRVILYIENGNMHVMRSQSTTSAPVSMAGTFVLDAEEFKGVYHVFDVLYANKSLVHEPFAVRMAALPTGIASVVQKTMVNITSAADVVAVYMQLATPPVSGGRRKVAKGAPTPVRKPRRGGSTPVPDLLALSGAKLPEDYDGLIFTPTHGDYWSIIYKWKPSDLRSSDFLVQYLDGKYILCCQVTFQTYSENRMSILPELFEANITEMHKAAFPIQFSPMITDPAAGLSYIWDNPDRLDIVNKVGEFIYVDGRWKLLTIRVDKLVGNSYRVCNENWNATFDPILITDFITSKKGYFTNTSSEHTEQRLYINRAKAALFDQLSADMVVDFGIGKFQDMHKYKHLGASLVIGVDTDVVALVEASTRRIENTAARFALVLYHTHMTNMSLVPQILAYGKADLIVSNLALHYSATSVSAFVDICRAIINSRGRVLIVDINAEQTDKLASPWEAYDAGILKYKIENAGPDEITVYYPFAKKMATEPKLYFGRVIDIFVAAGFTLASRGNLMAPEFNINRDKLSENDKVWISLWEYMLFTRV